MRVAAIFLLMLLSPEGHAPVLKIEPQEIQAGERVRLSWETQTAPAFIIGYGKVVGTGSAIISPAHSTDFTMVSETQGHTIYRTVHLAVNGAKGDDQYPPLSGFDTAIQGRHVKTSYVDFQGIVWNTLQNKGYLPRGDYAPGRPYVTFFTNYALRPDLVLKSERIRARHLAIAVDIYEPKRASPVKFGVRTSLEFEYLGEKEWRPDKESAIGEREAKSLVQSLEQAR